jgi:hypothetical protein
MEALGRCLKGDPDAGVRARAGEGLAVLAQQRRPRVFPLALLEALGDPSEEVVARVSVYGITFKEFPPETVPLLHKLAQSPRPYSRRAVYHFLAQVDGKGAKTRRLLRAATKDSDDEARNAAHVTLFAATGELEDILPYYLLRQQGMWKESPAPRKPAPKTDRERARQNLLRIGAFAGLFRLSQERSEDVARALAGHLGLRGKSAELRRAAAEFIGNLAHRDAPGLLVSVSPEVRGPEGKPPVMKLASRYAQFKIPQRLRELRDNDPDRPTRAAAAYALEMLRNP